MKHSPCIEIVKLICSFSDEMVDFHGAVHNVSWFINVNAKDRASGLFVLPKKIIYFPLGGKHIEKKSIRLE